MMKGSYLEYLIGWIVQPEEIMPWVSIFNLVKACEVNTECEAVRQCGII